MRVLALDRLLCSRAHRVTINGSHSIAENIFVKITFLRFDLLRKPRGQSGSLNALFGACESARDHLAERSICLSCHNQWNGRRQLHVDWQARRHRFNLGNSGFGFGHGQKGGACANVDRLDFAAIDTAGKSDAIGDPKSFAGFCRSAGGPLAEISTAHRRRASRASSSKPL
jgi:hypothetical protein